MAATEFSIHRILVIVFIACSVEINKGSVINFTSTGPITPLLTESLNLTCSFNSSSPPFSGAVIGRRSEDASDTTENVHPIAILIIRADGQQVASVSEHSGVKIHVADPNINVSGRLEWNTRNYSSLEVSWKYPTESHKGGYRCEVNSMDDFGHGVIFSKNISINVAEPSISDLVRHIHKTEVENRQQRDELVQQKIQIDILKSENVDLKGVVNDLKTMYQTSLDDTTDLRTKYQMVQRDIAELKHVESGHIDCGRSSTSAWSDGYGRFQDAGRIIDKTQAFNTAYATAPVVYLSVKDREYYQGGHSLSKVAYGVFLQSVDNTKFVLRCYVDSGSGGHMSYMSVSWISISK